MTEQNQRPKGRPVGTGNEYSPLKFAEADEALRLILKRTTLPPHIHLRAAELLLLVNGVQLIGEPTKRDKRIAKELVSEHSFETELNKSIDAKLLQQRQEAAAAEKAEREAAQAASVSDIFASILADIPASNPVAVATFTKPDRAGYLRTRIASIQQTLDRLDADDVMVTQLAREQNQCIKELKSL